MRLRRRAADTRPSATFTSQEIATALYRTYPDRFPRTISGSYTVAMTMHGDDALVVRYYPKSSEPYTEIEP